MASFRVAAGPSPHRSRTPPPPRDVTLPPPEHPAMLQPDSWTGATISTSSPPTAVTSTGGGRR
ncbi:hypothetical protein [Streptomyces albogriseolus]|uniref:hypothetical protein n=1 Tax=Streptomyces albogriseolus TaxID=1887 RepID=UPI00346170A1